jgi:hypothetical protein
VFLLSGSALISALMKYQISVVSGEEVPLPAGRSKASGTEASRLMKEVESLKKELSEARVLNKLAVGREFRMIELKQRIKELESKGKGR